MMNQQKYIPVIGLEVHVELKTKSKMFCGCSADYFGKEPNTHVCPVCLGLPGALPVPNRTAIDWCIMIGLALNCDINLFSKFDRKNYFYPDLPKGYQISQYDQPFGVNGSVVIARSDATKQSSPHEIATRTSFARNDTKEIRIRRVHMEEDTGKLIHEADSTLIDFNRSGVPLVEIVTEPDFENEKEVVEYLKKLQQIVRYLDVSNADMEKGDMRLEPNVSLRTRNTTNKQILPISNEELPNYKIEVKNINSFRFVEKAIEYEVKRQQELLEKGETPKQETRGWDELHSKTVSQRSKEEAHDYRYFPEPDIPPIAFTKKQIEDLKRVIPELPDEKQKRFIKDYSLSQYYAKILTNEKSTADFFEKSVEEGISRHVSPKDIANVMVNKKIDIKEATPAEIVKQIVEKRIMESIDEKELENIIIKVLQENTTAVNDYKKGKHESVGFLIGKTAQALQGKKINPQLIKKLLETLLQK